MKLCGAKIYLLTRTKSDLTSDTGEAEVSIRIREIWPLLPADDYISQRTCP